MTGKQKLCPHHISQQNGPVRESNPGPPTLLYSLNQMSPEFLKVTGQDTQEDAVGRETPFFPIGHWTLGFNVNVKPQKELNSLDVL